MSVVEGGSEAYIFIILRMPELYPLHQFHPTGEIPTGHRLAGERCYSTLARRWHNVNPPAILMSTVTPGPLASGAPVCVTGQWQVLQLVTLVTVTRSRCLAHWSVTQLVGRCGQWA